MNGSSIQLFENEVYGQQNAPYARLTQKGVDWCVTHYANIPAQMKAM